MTLIPCTRWTHPRRHLLALLATATLLAGACGDDGDEGVLDEPTGATTPDGDPTTTTDGRPEIDARRYYDEYEVESESDMAAGAPNTTSAPAMSESADTTGPSLPPVPPGPLDDNTFEGTGVNPFVATTTDALSTFGLDVDTGSWSVGRSFLDSGYRPEPDSVRVEEYVNAFEYGYVAPTVADLAVAVDTGPMPLVNDDTQLVRVGVQAREVDDADRPDAVITLVVDTSGSMDIRERLGLVQSSLAVLANQLRPTDVVAVVTYGDESSVLLPPTPVSETDAIVDAIDALGPEGSTNMEAGLRLGYETARAAFTPGALNVVLLASDGVANVGDTGPGSLAEMIRQAGSEGIHLVTVGYGLGNYNDVLMEQLADQGDGFYAYVDTFEEAERLFSAELTSTLTVVAEEARVQVAFDPAVVAEYRLLGYENRAIADEDFTDLGVDTGEIGAGHSVTALYEVKLRPGAPEDGLVATLHLRYRSPETAATQETVKKLRRSDLAPSWEQASPALRLAGSVAEFAEILRKSPWAGGTAGLPEVLRQAQPAAKALPRSEAAGEFLDLVRRAAAIGSSEER
jgi:Ca-activated chloride channel family protein